MKLRPSEKKSLVTMGAVALGALAISFVIVDRDRIRERAHDLAMAGRGTYR